MTNPLDVADGWIGQRPGMTEDDLRAWCAERNALRLFENMERWYYVAVNKETGIRQVQALDGIQAQEVRRVRTGWMPDYHGWDEGRLAGHYRLLRWYLEQGTKSEPIIPPAYDGGGE